MAFYKPKCYCLPIPRNNNTADVITNFEKLFNNKYSDFVTIFTDGSKNDNSVGCAFIIPNVGVEAEFSLNPVSSIFTAEAVAILEALKMIETFNFSKTLIVTDSKSVLQALSNFFNTSWIMFEIKKILSSLEKSGLLVVFLWVPSHNGIPGNEEVYLLAKNALNHIDLTHSEIMHEDYFCKSKQECSTIWQLNWNNSPYGRQFFSIKTKVNVGPWFKDMTLNRPEITSINRLRFGHNSAGSHLYRLNIIDAAECECGLGIHDMDHYLLDCPLSDNEFRMPFLSRLRLQYDMRNISILNILRTNQAVIYNDLASYIKSSGLRL